MTLTPDNKVIQSFWTGAPLTTMERLSMQSFLANGHEFHLWTYDFDLAGVPDHVILRDASEIVPLADAAMFRCPQQLSDFFRIALLFKKGGWYSDLDNIALRPLDFPAEFCFYRDHDESTISFALSKAPAGSALMEHCYRFLSSMSAEERSRLAWQAIGSDFACGAVEYFKLTEFAQPGKTFDPVHWQRVRNLVDPHMTWDLTSSYSVHLFHAAWNQGPADATGRGFDLGQPLADLSTDAIYHPDCLYEQLKRRYL